MKMKKINLAIIFILIFFVSVRSEVLALDTCGQIILNTDSCDCPTNNNQESASRPGTKCCGWMKDNSNCSTYQNSKEYGCGEKITTASVPSGATCNCAGGQWTAYWQWKGVNRGVCCGFVQEGDWGDQCLRAPLSEINAGCGEVYDTGSKECVCGVGSGNHPMSGGKSCCGWMLNGECSPYDTAINSVGADAQTLNALNPLTAGGAGGGGDTSLTTPGAIISKALSSFIFPIAGIILFVVMLLGGFQILTGATNSKGLEEGKQKITSAIIGFILLFAAYWIAQLLELIFGIRILS